MRLTYTVNEFAPTGGGAIDLRSRHPTSSYCSTPCNDNTTFSIQFHHSQVGTATKSPLKTTCLQYSSLFYLVKHMWHIALHVMWLRRSSRAIALEKRMQHRKQRCHNKQSWLTWWLTNNLYSRVPNKRPGTRIYFPKNASLYGPYLALYVYKKKKKKIFFFFFISLHILATQFLRNTTNSPGLVVDKSWYLYNLSLGRLLEGDPLKCCLLIQAAGTGSDCASSNFAYNLWDLPPYTLIWHYTTIKFVRFATLYSYLALYVY